MSKTNNTRICLVASTRGKLNFNLKITSDTSTREFPSKKRTRTNEPNSTNLSSTNLNDNSSNATAQNITQLQSDEEFARKLQEDFNRQYNEILKNEEIDFKFAQSLSNETNEILEIDETNTNQSIIDPLNSIFRSTIQNLTRNVTNNSNNESNNQNRTQLSSNTAPVRVCTCVQCNQARRRSQNRNYRRRVALPAAVNLENIQINYGSNFAQTIIQRTSQSQPSVSLIINNQTERIPSSNSNVDLGRINNKFDYLASYEFKKNCANQIENECPICLEEYENDCYVTPLACFHKFHTDCIKKWLKRNDHCPLCKKNALTAQ